MMLWVMTVAGVVLRRVTVRTPVMDCSSRAFLPSRGAELAVSVPETLTIPFPWPACALSSMK